MAEHSTVGLALAAVSLVVMPLLSYGQRRSGRDLGSASAVADSKQTLLCTYLSAVLLVGLGLNSLFAGPGPTRLLLWSSGVAAATGLADLAGLAGLTGWPG